MTQPFTVPKHLSEAEASKLISEKTAAAYAAINEAEAIADEYGVDFSFSVSYGMGGYYSPKPKNDDYNDSSCYGEDSYGWNSSSAYC